MTFLVSSRFFQMEFSKYSDEISVIDRTFTLNRTSELDVPKEALIIGWPPFGHFSGKQYFSEKLLKILMRLIIDQTTRA